MLFYWLKIIVAGMLSLSNNIMLVHSLLLSNVGPTFSVSEKYSALWVNKCKKYDRTCIRGKPCQKKTNNHHHLTISVIQMVYSMMIFISQGRGGQPLVAEAEKCLDLRCGTQALVFPQFT